MNFGKSHNKIMLRINHNHLNIKGDLGENMRVLKWSELSMLTGAVMCWQYVMLTVCSVDIIKA